MGGGGLGGVKLGHDCDTRRCALACSMLRVQFKYHQGVKAVQRLC